MKKRIVLVVVLELCMVVEVAKADFTFGEPTNLGPVVNSSYNEFAPCISADGSTIYFSSNLPGTIGYTDIWITTRPTKDDPWTDPMNLGSTINSNSYEWLPHISADGLKLYFHSDRPGGSGYMDLWVATRKTSERNPEGYWTEPQNLGSTVNSAHHDASPYITDDGIEFFFTSDRPGGLGDHDIWMMKRVTTEESWGEPVNLGPTINSASRDRMGCLSPDGLILFFDSQRPGGYGELDLWMSKRPTVSDDWGPPVNLGPPVNTVYTEGRQSISSDGSTLYFSSSRSGGLGYIDLWQAPIIPIVDFNGDGIVDAADMVIMVDQWGTNNSLCDIGPMPWGDGIVDVQDLVVLAEHLFEPFPPVGPVEVNEDDNGGQVELKLGQILVVTLESNPSTGYRWQQTENPESILKQIGEAEFMQSETGDPPLVGAGGWEVFRFRAASAGQMTLQLVYHRPWEEDVEPLKTFSLQVTVP